ncbi:MAG: mobile mystery protein A [Bryobacteraceae bacterium]|jgi:predicted DNA-binding mobile mystery protein A
MQNAKLTARSRSHLDNRFKKIGPTTQFAAPARGWIRAIREGLGMSSAQLAVRLGVKQPTVVAMEQSEAKATIELATLRRVAEALGCTLVYALVPNKPLETTVRERARALASRGRVPIQHSMLLENQKVSAKEPKARLDEFVREVNPRRLWDDA